MSESQFTPSQSWIDAHRDSESSPPPPQTPESHRKTPLTLLERISPPKLPSTVLAKTFLSSPGRPASTRLIDRIAPTHVASVTDRELPVGPVNKLGLNSSPSAPVLTEPALLTRIEGMASTCASPTPSTSHLPPLQVAPNTTTLTSSSTISVCGQSI